ncbi:MAG: hypothetical protein C4524_14350 [Candidatus Zixiibacteriota bacterium]|nr:MAG: hypothetical protein C4524_14350 [candidate division Zixibacteria bacterium]
MADLLICVDRKDFPGAIPGGALLPDSAPTVLCGPVDILRRPRLTLLNSRQSPRLSSTSTWARITVDALESFDPRECAVVSSLGTVTWDLLTWAAGRHGFPLILVYPAGSAQGFALARTKAILDFCLNPEAVLAVRPIRLGPKRTLAEDHAARDRWILALADRPVALGLRPGGNLEALLSRLPIGTMDSRFRLPWQPPPTARGFPVPKVLRAPAWYDPEAWLIHWTRACTGQYPGETRADYFHRVMVEGKEERDGWGTLERILEEGVIRASTKLVRRGYPVVSFTARPPEDLPRLCAWHAGLRRWTFEPFGLALNRHALMQLGARPVVYGDEADWELLPDAERPYFQALGGKHDWREEKEWRVRGDVRLAGFAPDEILVLAAGEGARKLRPMSPFRVVNLSG